MTMRPRIYRPKNVFFWEHKSLGRCFPWTMRSLDDAFLGRCVTWAMRSLDDASLRRFVPWTMRPLNDASRERCVPWTIRLLYETSLTDVSRHTEPPPERLAAETWVTPECGCYLGQSGYPKLRSHNWTHGPHHVWIPVLYSPTKPITSLSQTQGVTKRCRLSWLTNSAL